jgi:hypothetical protein
MKHDLASDLTPPPLSCSAPAPSRNHAIRPCWIAPDPMNGLPTEARGLRDRRNRRLVGERITDLGPEAALSSRCDVAPHAISRPWLVG